MSRLENIITTAIVTRSDYNNHYARSKKETIMEKFLKGNSSFPNYHGAKSHSVAFKEIKNADVPTWFIRRYFKELVHIALWLKVNGGGVLFGVEKEDDLLILWNDEALISTSLDTYMRDGNEYKDMYRLRKAWFNPQIVIQAWRNLKNKYLRVYGLNCKSCNKHKKNTQIICDSLDKYSLHICDTCLKKFCKLDMNIQKIRYAKMLIE